MKKLATLLLLINGICFAQPPGTLLNPAAINGYTTNGKVLITANNGTYNGVPTWTLGLPLSMITGTTSLLTSASSYTNPSWLSSLAWSKITGTPTTISGYGIIDALINGALSSGYVPYAAGSNSLTNSTIYTDGTNTAVGITTTSLGRFTIQPVTGEPALVIKNTTGNDGVISFNQNGTDRAQIYTKYSDGTFNIHANNNDIVFQNGVGGGVFSETLRLTYDGNVNFPNSTASKLAFFDASKNLIPLNIGTGLSVTGTTLSATGTSSTTILTASTNITISGTAPNYTISTPTQTTGLATIASPTLTGSPASVTYSINSNNTGIATNAYVDIKTPFVTPEMYGAIGDGVTNDYTALQNAINSSYQVVFANRYLTLTTLTVTNNESFVGTGNNAAITVSTNIALVNCLGANNHFENMSFEGATSLGHGGLNMGIQAIGNTGLTLYYVSNTIHNCHFKNLNTGVYTASVVGTSSGANHEGSFTVSDCIMEYCTSGINCAIRGEYNTFSNNKYQFCTNGIVITGGNNNIVGGQATDNTIGILFGTGTNDAHCGATGVKFNHNTTNISGAHALDWTFSNCQFYAGKISLTSVGKTIFNGCELSMTSQTLTINTSPVYFNNCNWVAIPGTYTLTSTAPIMNNCYNGTAKLYTPLLAYSEITAGTLDFPNTVAGASSDLTIAVTGSVLSDAVALGIPNASMPAATNTGNYLAWVSAAGTVTVRFINDGLVTALDPASGSFKVFLHK